MSGNRGLFIGATTIDLIYPIEEFPKENSKVNVANRLIELGGPATNAAISFTALGGEATLISVIGENEWSAMMKNYLRAYGVSHVDLADHLPTEPMISSILVNVKSGLRTVIASNVKNPKYGCDFPQPDLSKFDVICVDGFYPEVLLSLSMDTPFHIPVVFDGGSYKPKTTEILSLVDYPILSERFTLPGGLPMSKFVGELGRGRFAITRNELPISVYEQGHFNEIPVPQVKAVDTLGAGDIFHGVFSWYITQSGATFSSALEQSSKIAALSCQYLGPREWMNHRQ